MSYFDECHHVAFLTTGARVPGQVKSRRSPSAWRTGSGATPPGVQQTVPLFPLFPSVPVVDPAATDQDWGLVQRKPAIVFKQNKEVKKGTLRSGKSVEKKSTLF